VLGHLGLAIVYMRLRSLAALATCFHCQVLVITAVKGTGNDILVGGLVRKELDVKDGLPLDVLYLINISAFTSYKTAHVP